MFAALAMLRMSLQFSYEPSGPIGLTLTALMYLIPGAVVGLVASRIWWLCATIVGVVSAVVVWGDAYHQLRGVPFVSQARAVAFFAFVGIVGVFVGAAVTTALFRRPSSHFQ